LVGHGELMPDVSLHARPHPIPGLGVKLQQAREYVLDVAVLLGLPALADGHQLPNVVPAGIVNRCLDNAIADAVTEFSYQRDFAVADRQAIELHERLGFFAHELRNFLQTATLAFTAAKTGNLSLSGATGAVLERSLDGLRDLITHSLEEVRASSGFSAQTRMFPVAAFIAEVKRAAELAAEVRGCVLTVSSVDPRLAVSGDRDQLYAALGNLLQNAFKFTHPNSEVTLDAYAVSDRILIDVKDHCGGLPPGDAERMFLPFSQNGEDRTGLGLGLSIARRSVEANNGVLSVRDLPGTGCVFTISLPRYATTAAS
jgi:signal transduction histidine kinase